MAIRAIWAMKNVCALSIILQVTSENIEIMQTNELQCSMHGGPSHLVCHRQVFSLHSVSPVYEKPKIRENTCIP